MFELLSIPAILTIVEALKMAGFPARYCAIASIFIGFVIGYFLADIVGGMVFGLAASGSYSGVKALLQLSTAAERDKTWDVLK